MSLAWYAIRSKPRKEDALWQQLLQRGFEGFYPRVRVQPVNPRARKVVPYFPGYLFVRADVAAVGLSVFAYMPHAVGLVCFGSEPAAVPENLIHRLRRTIDAVNAAGGESLGGFQPGDRVRVVDGPFEGYEGLFDARIPGQVRVRILLDMLSGRALPVELHPGYLEPV